MRIDPIKVRKDITLKTTINLGENRKIHITKHNDTFQFTQTPVPKAGLLDVNDITRDGADLFPNIFETTKGFIHESVANDIANLILQMNEESLKFSEKNKEKELAQTKLSDLVSTLRNSNES